jgi:hypothetical protein
MRKSTFSEFFNNTTELEEESLYLVKDTNNFCLYIGISNTGIWNRWFSSSCSSHMILNHNGKWYGESAIGQEIADNFPDSGNWLMEFYTVLDCAKLLNIDYQINDEDVRILNFNKSGWKTARIEDMEKKMIERFNPKLNVIYNTL